MLLSPCVKGLLLDFLLRFGVDLDAFPEEHGVHAILQVGSCGVEQQVGQLCREETQRKTSMKCLQPACQRVQRDAECLGGFQQSQIKNAALPHPRWGNELLDPPSREVASSMAQQQLRRANSRQSDTSISVHLIRLCGPGQMKCRW